MVVIPWPETPVETFDLDGWPVLYVRVTTPRDQALLHRYLAHWGYCPVIQEQGEGYDLWRFHHPEGPPP